MMTYHRFEESNTCVFFLTLIVPIANHFNKVMIKYIYKNIFI